MGIGDEIMASGHARAVHAQTGKRVQILDIEGNARCDDLWRGLHWIAMPHERGDFAQIRNAPGCRPYLVYPWTRRTGQRFTAWRARDHVGGLELGAEAIRFADQVVQQLGEFIVIEPSISPKSNPNKQWGARSWRQLARLLIDDGRKVVQLSPYPIQVGDGVHHVRTRTFRQAAAVLARASISVLPEGGLHHAAGVLGAPAVVLFGGTISPETTGYAHHVNIADARDGSPCGAWSPCQHCESVWADLSPHQVFEIAREQINARRAA